MIGVTVVEKFISHMAPTTAPVSTAAELGRSREAS